jgi:hypothetical protein
MTAPTKRKYLNGEDLALTLYYYSTLSTLLDVREEDVVRYLASTAPTSEQCCVIALWDVHVQPLSFDREKLEYIILEDGEGEYILPYMLFGNDDFSKEMYIKITDQDTLTAIHSYTGLTKRIVDNYRDNITPEVWNLTADGNIITSEACMECLAKLSVIEMATHDVKKKCLIRYEMGNVLSLYLTCREEESDEQEAMSQAFLS